MNSFISCVPLTRLPSRIKTYKLTEIGRAGRNGEDAIARAILIEEDAVAQNSLSHSNGCSKSQIAKFLTVVETATAGIIQDIPRDVLENLEFSELDICVPVTESINMSDLREETVETLLSIMEEDEFGNLLLVEGSMYDRCILTLKRRELEEVPEQVAKCVLKCGIKLNSSTSNAQLEEFGGTALDKGFHAYAKGNWMFSVLRVAHLMGQGCQPRHVFAALRRLECEGEIEVQLEPSKGKGFLTRLNKAAVAIFSKHVGAKKMGEEGRKEKVDGLAHALHERMMQQEANCERKIKDAFDTLFKLFKVSESSIAKAQDKGGADFAEKARKFRGDIFAHVVDSYFCSPSAEKATPNNDDEAELLLGKVTVPTICKAKMNESDLRRIARDVTNLRFDSRLENHNFVEGAVCMDDFDYAARASCNILHGIDLPRQPQSIWWGTQEWCAWRDYDYNDMLSLCQKVFGESS